MSNLKKLENEIEKHISTSMKIIKLVITRSMQYRVDKFSDSSIDMYVRCFTVTDEWSEWLKVKERLALSYKRNCRKK